MAVTNEPVMQFECPSKFNIESLFYDTKHHLQPWGCGGDVKIISQRMNESINESVNDGGVCRAAPGFALFC